MQKRKPKHLLLAETYPLLEPIKRIFPFKWTLCNKCQREFCLERGWKCYGGDCINRKYTLCHDCAPSAEQAFAEADKYYDDLKRITYSTTYGGSITMGGAII